MVGEGLPSADVLATPRTVPWVPQTPVAVAGNQSVDVSWVASSFDGGNDITSYEVAVLDGSGLPTVLDGCTAAAPALECTVDGLTNGEDYSFSIVAVNAAGSSVAAITSVVTPLAVPQSPTDLAVELGNGAITVSWVAPVDTGGTALTGFTVTADPGGASCTAAAGDTSCVVTGLTKGSTYTFEVVAQNSVGDSLAGHDRRDRPDAAGCASDRFGGARRRVARSDVGAVGVRRRSARSRSTG